LFELTVLEVSVHGCFVIFLGAHGEVVYYGGCIVAGQNQEEREKENGSSVQ
jgi:hypothetical protein